MALNLGTVGQANGLSQSSGPFQLISSQVNGSVLGSLSGVTIGEDGIVTSLFTNGTSRPIYKLPIATFRNPDGLASRTGNAWNQSDVSGPYTLKDAGTQGAGKVSAGALESSTVDLAQEFSNMIITQRAYSASGKIITTADEMLDELIRLKR
jgi:flagellar hook protein FlgE